MAAIVWASTQSRDGSARAGQDFDTSYGQSLYMPCLVPRFPSNGRYRATATLLVPSAPWVVRRQDLRMIRFGLLGCGRIAKRHSDLLGGNHIEGASLVAVCDPVRARADAVAGKFGVAAHGDMDEFLARKDIDVVAVLTPSGLHPAHVIACARAGKHVVVEKPMALRLQDADDMIRACDQAGVKMFV